MQVTPPISPAGVLATAIALLAIALPSHASSRRTVLLDGNPIDGRTSIGAATPFTISDAHKPTGVAFGNAASRHTGADRVPLLSFAIHRIGPVDDDHEVLAADALVFDRSGNFYVAHFSARTIVKFNAAGPIDVFHPSEFAPPPHFMAIQLGNDPAIYGHVNPDDPTSKRRIGPIPEPAGVGLLTAIALLGLGVGSRVRRENIGARLCAEGAH